MDRMRGTLMDSRQRGNDRPMRYLIPVLIFPLSLMLSACGQSGDLYLPAAKPAPVTSVPSAPVAAPVAEDKKPDEEPAPPTTEPAPASP